MSNSSAINDDAEMLDLLNSLADKKPRQRNRLGSGVLSVDETLRRVKTRRHHFAHLPSIEIPKLKSIPPSTAQNATADPKFRTVASIKGMLVSKKTLQRNSPKQIVKSASKPIMMNLVSDSGIRRVRKKPRKTIIASVTFACFCF
jgi:hypothetical protein